MYDLTNCPAFTTEVWQERCFPFKNVLLFPLPTQYNVRNQNQAVVFNIVWGEGADVRQVKLYSCLACAPKRQKCKFVQTFVHDCRYKTSVFYYFYDWSKK